MSGQKVITIGLQHGLDINSKKQIIGQIQNIKGVFNVAALDENATEPGSSAVYFARLDKNASEDSVIAEIKKIDGVRYAEKPAPRRLL